MRVLLADDHALFRAGIERLLRAWDIDVVGHAGNGFEAVEEARRLRPDLVLMDVRMPDCNGIEAVRLIKAELPEIKIVMVTVSDDDRDVFEAVKAGADGYLLKDMTEEELGSTLTAVAEGKPAMSPALAARIVEEFARADRAAREGPEALTARESEVLRLVVGGGSNREIALALRVSENTVGYHMKHILAKLHVKNRAQAAVLAVRSGLAESPDR